MDAFEQGKSYFVFGHNVKLRKGPSTDDEVIKLLAIGDEVEIIEKQEVMFQIDGYEANWFEVKSGDKSGFVVGALLAEQGFSFQEQRFLVNKGFDGLYIRAMQREGKYTELKFNPNGWVVGIQASDNKGLKGIRHILYIDYQGECCGCEMGGSYIFYDGNRLIHAIDVSASGDGGYVDEESIIFPAEKEGLAPNKIIFQSRSSEVIDEDTNWEETHTISRELEWEEGEFYPKDFRKGRG